MDIMTILICIGTGLLTLAGVALVAAFFLGAGMCIVCIVEADKPTWVGVLGVSILFIAFAVLVGYPIAFDLGWIADCPWCEAKP